MVEKQASSEIAESWERFEKWFREGACFPDDLRRDSSGMYYAMGPRRLYEAWEQAERDTRELCAQLAREYLKLWPTMAAELAERIRGKE